MKVPSDAERGGDFSDLCPGTDCPHQADGSAFPGNMVPIDPNAQFLLAVLPQANGTNNGFPTYTNSTSLPTTWREELMRVDHNITDNYRLTFRYIHDSWKTIMPGLAVGRGHQQLPERADGFRGPGHELRGAPDSEHLAQLAERICGQLHGGPHYFDDYRSDGVAFGFHNGVAVSQWF